MKKNNIYKGNRAEDKAALFLEDKGYKILHRNWRCYIGEIDIVAQKKTYLCFIEVKYRADTRFGSPREAVTVRKRQKLVNLAKIYIARSDRKNDIRFDVIEITGKNINHIKNAFRAE